MKIDGLLQRAQLEHKTSDYASSITGAIWFRTDTDAIKFSTGAAVRTILDSSMPDASTIELSTLTLQVKAGGITATQLASNAVTTAKILDANVTTAKIADGNVTPGKLEYPLLGLTGSSGLFGTLSTTPIDVTNLSQSIAAIGRPVEISLQPDGANQSYIGVSGDNEMNLLIYRGATKIAEFNMSSADPLTIPPSSIHFVDFPTAGTYTYKIQVQAVGSTFIEVRYVKMMVYQR